MSDDGTPKEGVTDDLTKRPSVTGGKLGPKRVITRERMRQVLELRRAGATLQAIADQLGYKGPSSVHKVLKTAMREILREPAEELRKLEYERLERMTLAVWAQATKGHMGAIATVVRLMERRAKLLGLDAPMKMALQGGAEGAPPVRVDSGLDLSRLSQADLKELERIMAAGSSSPEPLPPGKVNGVNGANGHQIPG